MAHTQLTAERLELAFKRAGLPPNVLQTIHLSPELVTHAIEHPLVHFVSFTGSVAAGRSVEKTAAQAKPSKGVALEVGHLVMNTTIYKNSRTA